MKAIRRYQLLIVLFLASSLNALSQDTMKKPKLITRVYSDLYYSYDFANPASHRKAPFLYNYNRHNEMNVNLAFASVSYKSNRQRASLALMAGTYAQSNLVAESQVMRHIYEASAGIKLAPKTELWLDVGIMPSHIGFESAESKTCWTLSRSILAENSPYYESGVKVSYTSRNNKLYLAGLFLNGWQRIKRIEGNNTPALGTQLSYSPSEKLKLNWSTFLGNDKPDSVKRWRYFNNLYAIWQFQKKWGLTLGFDFGMEQKQSGSSRYNNWYSPIAIVRYDGRDWSIAARMEFYKDKEGVIIPLVNDQPFAMKGFSINFDKRLRDNFLWRIEWRSLVNSSPYFVTRERISSSNHSVTGSLVIEVN